MRRHQCMAALVAQYYRRRRKVIARIANPRMNTRMQETLLSGTADKAELPGWLVDRLFGRQPQSRLSGCAGERAAARQQEMPDLGGGERRTEQVALHFIAPKLAQHFQLLLRFDALRRRRHSAGGGDVDDGLHDAG